QPPLRLLSSSLSRAASRALISQRKRRGGDMYGTVARMKVKPGELEQLQKTMQDWDAQGGSVDGAVATYIYQTDNDPNELIMAVTERIAQLLPEAQEFLAEEKKMFIGGKWVDAASGETFATIDPARDEELAQVPLAGQEDVDRAVGAARDAFEDGRWSDLEPRK